jgi:hypothetical protein
MLEEKVNEVKELIKGLWWVSEADYPWIVEIVSELSLDLDHVERIELENFFAIATEVKSWHSEAEK